MEPVQAPDLEVDDNPSFQKREWRVQRIGWALLALVATAAAAGLLGPGPLSSATAGDERFRVEYQRFVQRQAPMRWRLHLGRGPRSPRVWIERAYLEQFRIERIVPEPRSERAEPDRVVFEFDADAKDGGTAVTIFALPTQAATLRGRIGLVGGPAVGIFQLVYP